MSIGGDEEGQRKVVSRGARGMRREPTRKNELICVVRDDVWGVVEAPRICWSGEESGRRGAREHGGGDGDGQKV